MRSVGDGIVAVLPGKFCFEESPESYLSLSRGAVWGYFGYRFDYGVSGVCTRYMRRYGSIWLLCSLRMLDELTAGRRACMS